jgi:L-rhamnose mutarotase
MAILQFCLALDLVDDEALMADYKAHHQSVWPEVIQSIKDAGIHLLNIYCVGNRMFMMIEADETFSFEKKAMMDASNEKVQEWEKLMWKFQQALPWAKQGEKWMLMEKIFELP